MGSLTINFDGICAWIPAWAVRDLPDTLPDRLAWRVILPPGTNGLSYDGINSGGPKSIPPHIAIIDVGASPIAGFSGALTGVMQLTSTSWVVRGAAMTVANPTVPQDQPLQSPISLIPSLTQYANSDPNQPPVRLTLERNVIAGQRAFGYFDVVYGTLTPSYLGMPENKVAHVVYNVQTDGPPIVGMKTFFDQKMTYINFGADDITITIQNEGETGDTWWDWVIHYMVCTSIPATIIPPGPPSTDQVDGLTAGCSNSQFP